MCPHRSRSVAGRYQLEERLGVGGAGEVWRARDSTLGRTVAVKLVDIPDHLADDERERTRARVSREARAAARLDHPGVVTVFDIVDDGDDLAIVMELIDAPTLAELVAHRGPLDDERAAAVGAGVLDVLRVAHDAGVVHRDVKPSNVLVLDGQVKLTDFGIAAVAGDETELTRTGTALGSPSYLAPEQAEGHDAEPAADLWGLGTVLYFAVEGEPPFDRGRALATVRAVVSEDPRPMTSGSALAPLVRELLAKDPGARPGPDEVARRLDRVRAGESRSVSSETTVVMPAARRERPDHDPGSRRTSGLIGALLAVLAVAVIAGVAWLWTGATEDAGSDEPVPEAQQDPAAGGDETAAPTTAPPPSAASPDVSPTGGTSSPTPQPTSEPTADGAAEAIGGEPAEVPEDWTVYDGATYRVAHPPAWAPRQDTGPRVDLVDPDTGAYLRLDWTDQPKDDPVADWERQSEAFAERHADYEEIRIEPIEYRGYDAAIWEYAYSEGGQRFHAVNVGLTTGECGYALNLQTPAERWEELGELIVPFSASFEPTGC